MSPAPGEHLLRYVGDRLRVTLTSPPAGSARMSALLRTNLTRARVARAEVIAQAGLREQEELTFAGASWRDIPLVPSGEGFAIELPLLEAGHFLAKAYFRDETGRQYWPEGGNLSISVHPDKLRTGNTIYCAFPRATGNYARGKTTPEQDKAVGELDGLGWSVIPPSSTLRNLTRALPHIFGRLGCRILHLLPIGPVPTTYARMGRFGSPYAQLDLTAIDPALVEFDRRTTGVQQFRELADGVHLREGMVLLDIVLNHTGWGARLLDEHPEWFKRDASGTLHSPGAWGVVWADLVELDQAHQELWDVLADALIIWCRRGVDGFRCDAGYMIPVPAWQYIIARVRREFPECLFLLEGLGGAWEATERLLTEGGMQWAYSELFQCYDAPHVAAYLDHANRQSARIGTLVHYSETHDNDRLAKRGASWSLMRNRLSALSSHSGAFGFTSGVEWLCTTKIDVHEAHTLSWGAESNLVRELHELNQLLCQHPCFFDGAAVARVSLDSSPVLALARTSQDGRDSCLVLANLDPEQARELTLPLAVWAKLGTTTVDLLGQTMPATTRKEDAVQVKLAAAQVLCLADDPMPHGLSGDLYRVRRAQAAWAYTQLGTQVPHESLGPAEFVDLATFVAADPAHFLAAIADLDPALARSDLLAALRAVKPRYPRVVTFRPEHASRVTLLPPGHWLLVRDDMPFEVVLARPDGDLVVRSTHVDDGHVAAIPPASGEVERELVLRLNRFKEEGTIEARVRLLGERPTYRSLSERGLVLLVNGRGGMARLSSDLGAVQSKYDCLLGANLHPQVPCDRHVFIKRMRAWVDADGFITPLDQQNLASIDSGPPAVWTFAANAGEGRRVGVRLTLDMLRNRNITVARFERVPTESLDLPREAQARLIVRFDLEDRNFHEETHANEAVRARFEQCTRELTRRAGFEFSPAPDRQLTVSADRGSYFREPQWSHGIYHPIDAERGLGSHGDAYSPGWFELPLSSQNPVTFVCSAERDEPSPALVSRALGTRPVAASLGAEFETQLRRAAEAFIVRRGAGKTVVAGYPWFLDWGRDTFIAARGLIAAGYHEEVKHMLLTYAALERAGTLPNLMSGERDVSRESSDAPLWFALACEELAMAMGASLYELSLQGQRSLREVLTSIVVYHLAGAENGVRIDPSSGLVFSPSHYTWMDTNYPASTPREGYPIELSVLWLRCLQQLLRVGVHVAGYDLARQVELTRASLELFYRPDLGYCADTLHGARAVPAREAVADDHLRPNQLLAVSLGQITGARARDIVAAAERYLLVPGAMRTLAPKPVSYELAVRRGNGALLNDPKRPYWGHYAGDEDTRRKPAYHNGTAWVWWLPIYCEALAVAWDFEPDAVAAARAVLGSTGRLLQEGCLGQLPEVLDGDAPHAQRGCDAQAWSVTEVLRVWLRLNG